MHACSPLWLEVWKGDADRYRVSHRYSSFIGRDAGKGVGWARQSDAIGDSCASALPRKRK